MKKFYFTKVFQYFLNQNTLKYKVHVFIFIKLQYVFNEHTFQVLLIDVYNTWDDKMYCAVEVQVRVRVHYISMFTHWCIYEINTRELL